MTNPEQHRPSDLSVGISTSPTPVVEKIDTEAPKGEPRYPSSPSEWANFPVRTVYYRDERGTRGRRLYVDGWSVMEDWEEPLQKKVVADMFQHIHSDVPRILIRGEGLGIATKATIEQMQNRGGGILHIQELHPMIMENGKKRVARLLGSETGDDRIKIIWHLGESIEDTKRFPDNSLDGINSDTFPLSKDQKDFNDFVDHDTVVRVLRPTGVFSGFIGHPHPTEKQLAYFSKYFRNYSGGSVLVDPPKNCPYYNETSMGYIVGLRPIKKADMHGTSVYS